MIDRQTALLMATLAKSDRELAHLMEKLEENIRPKSRCQYYKKCRQGATDILYLPCPNDTDRFEPCQWCVQERLLGIEHDCLSCHGLEGQYRCEECVLEMEREFDAMTRMYCGL